MFPSFLIMWQCSHQYFYAVNLVRTDVNFDFISLILWRGNNQTQNLLFWSIKKNV